ncbi:MAG: AAA family ATPase [Candidatus Goldiibacteriota bacterium]
MSYEQFYGLAEQPFSNSPDSRFFFGSEPHSDALTRLMYAAETMKGLVVMTGDIGTGKTTLARMALEKLGSDDRYVESLLVMVHTEISASWLLHRIAAQIGIENPAEEKEVLIPQLYKRLMDLHEAGKKAVVIIDEANMITKKEVFEEFRGLMNLEVPGSKLITLVLLGMPELEENIKIDPALQQRIAIKFILKKLDRPATAAYINHRMNVAGAQRKIFTDMALDSIYDYSGGTPRLINTICDNALLESFLMKRDLVDIAVIDNVISDLGLVKI